MTTPFDRARRHWLAAAAVLGLAWMATAAPALAHGDEGEMAVTVVEQTGPATVHVEVGITYANDDDLAQDATVSATLAAPDGTTVGPVPLTLVDESSSKYGAEVEVPSPGTWSVAVTSTEPEAEASGTVEVSADAPATSTTSASSASSAGTPTSSDEAGSDAAAAPAEDDDESSSGGLVLPLVVIGAVVAAVVGYAVARKRSST